MTVARFLPGQELNRLFYWEIIRPLLADRFPDLVYSAALIGPGSDALGYDTVVSTDHEWGPRGLLFLRDDDYAEVAPRIDEALRQELPTTFRGYSTSFSAPDVSGVRCMMAGEAGRIDHHVELHTLRRFVQRELGIEPDTPLSARDWLAVPEQRLLHVTAGTVYHDGLELLTPLRERLAYYPLDVWRYRLAAQWMRISQEEAFMGRCGDAGDELGSRIIAARLVRDLMKLLFLQERRYAPYSKWLGSAFIRLPGADILVPYLSAGFAAATWQEREQQLSRAYALLAMRQNALGIAAHQDPQTRRFHGRAYQVIHAERFVDTLVAMIRDPDVKRIVTSVGVVGGVDQFVDSTDVLERPPLCHHVGAVLGS
ncbi:MAG TPA: DUF4037 domain-containing protein [Ktedonobacterales bacterium]|nr:DUF4037 domain-containing protein [Ktedonobacterales bacterium]